MISGDILRAITSEDGDEITYSLVKPSRLGRIIKPNQLGQFEEITKFTQTEVNNVNIYLQRKTVTHTTKILDLDNIAKKSFVLALE